VVNYTVRVTLDKNDPAILLGATSTVVIDTGAASTLLTVPVSAVQTDDQGEYVMVVGSDDRQPRVSVVSGTVVGTTVVVTGGLKVGDVVQLVTSSATTPLPRAQVPAQLELLVVVELSVGQGSNSGTKGK